MNARAKSLFKEWGIPILLIGILWVTGWHKPVIAFMQQMILTTGVIKPDTSLENVKDYGTASYDWELFTTEGIQIPAESLRGKVVFLNFFATWCPPCIAEMPGIQKLYEDVASEDIVFVILSRDDSIMKTEEFMDKKEYTLPLYGARNIPQEFSANVLPTTFIINKSGKIVSKHSGMADYNNESVRDFLTTLASE